MTLQVKQLAEEIIAHVRDVAGADALVSAFTVAKKEVSAVRSERKRRAAVQVMLSMLPAACPYPTVQCLHSMCCFFFIGGVL